MSRVARKEMCMLELEWWLIGAVTAAVAAVIAFGFIAARFVIH